jgi:GntR family transcriptional regulator/MocR family aminotransferase
LQDSRRRGPEPLFEIAIERPRRGSRDAARNLFSQLAAAIRDGRLAAGTKLPPTRTSAALFGVSRNTMVKVYDRLLQHGHVVTRRSSGTYVAAAMARHAAPKPSNDTLVSDRRLNSFWLSDEVGKAIGFWRDSPGESNSPRPNAIDFRPALVDPRLFPFDVFRRVSAKQLRRLERKPARSKSPQGNQGNYHLREAISRHVALTRAVVCDSDAVLVTSGAQQAFDLLARTLVTSGKTVVAIEDPGYPPMRVAFAAAGATVVPVAIDDEGLLVEKLPRDTRVICVCPSHQFPLGVAMSARRRKALIEFARTHDAVIIEDDYDGEFRYDTPLEALRTFDAADVVFYVGTFSKCMLPALRLGFIVAPRWAIGTLAVAKNCLDWHCSTPLQTSVAGFILEGHLARHVRKMRTLYRRRRELLLNFLRHEIGNALAPIPSFYGMHITAISHERRDLDPVAEALHENNVKIHTLRRYFLGSPTHDGLVFGYGAADVADMKRGLALLKKALPK